MTRRLDSHLLLLLLLFAAAFALRIYDLDGQSFWSDEGLSLYRIRQPLDALLANNIVVDGIVTRDTTPPFYFLLGHLWRAVSGETVFALRYWGALAGVLAVPLAYLLGRLFYGRLAGLSTAFFFTISPFHVWQSQVLRNYGLLLTLNLLAMYALFRWVARRQQWRWLWLWLVASLLGTYTHYFGLFVLAYGLLVVGITAVFHYNLAQWLRQKWVWLAGAVAGLLLLPLLRVGWERFGAGPQVDFHPVSLSQLVENGLSAFAIGMSPILVHPASWVAPVAALALVGLVVGCWRSPRGALLLLGYQLVPLGLLLLLSFINPLYNGTRHLLIGLPPFLLFLGLGMAGLERGGDRAQRLVNGLLLLWGVGVALGQLGWLHAQFTAPELRRDDIRGAAAYIGAQATADDVVVLHDTLIRFVFDYYYDGAAPVVAVPTYGMYDAETAVSALKAIGQQADRIWFLSEPTPRNGFPRRLLDSWVDKQWLPLGSRTFDSMWLSVRLKLFTANGVVASVPETAVSFATSWDDALHLHGVVGLDEPLLTGGTWSPQFFWSHDGATRDYQLALRFVDEDGTLWGEVGWPLWPASKPSLWPAGRLFAEQPLVQLPAGLPPGSYQLQLRLIDLTTQAPVLLPDGSLDLLLQTAVTVVPNQAPNPRDLPPHTPLAARWRDVALLGYGLDADDVYRPGHKIPVAVYWRAIRPLPQPTEWVIQLVDEAGQVVGEAAAALTRASYPATGWLPGELLQGQMRVAVPDRAVQDSYLVRLRLRDLATGRWLSVNRWGGWVDLGAVAVRPWSLQTELPPLPQTVGVLFGEPPFAELAGFGGGETAVVPGETVPLTLYWRTVGETAVNYRIFLHLIDEQGELVAQGDDFPVNGVRPTRSWRVGEVLTDEHELLLPSDLPPGRYGVWMGLYSPDTGERPLLTQAGAVLPDGRLLLTTLAVR